MDGAVTLTSPFYLLIPLALMSLIPFAAVVGTSFLKIVIVFSILRNATGLQQIPPNIAMNALAIILSIYIMAPVGTRVYESVTSMEMGFSIKDPAWQEEFRAAALPYKEFLLKNTERRERNFFYRTASALWPDEDRVGLSKEDFIILIPAFCISELTRAFQIGFLLYLPFIVIDLIVSNILLAMGMMMVSPMTISLPFKLLLFVMLDGWTRLTHNLVLSYG